MIHALTLAVVLSASQPIYIPLPNIGAGVHERKCYGYLKKYQDTGKKFWLRKYNRCIRWGKL